VDVICLTARIPAAVVGGIVAAPGRARQLRGQVEATFSEARSLLLRAGAVVDRVESDLDDVEALIRRVHGTVDAVGATVGSAAVVVADAAATGVIADEVATRLQRLQELYEPSLRALAPILDQAARGLRPEQVRSLGRLLDLVPDVLDKIEPALRNLAELAPELELVTERVDDVGQIIEGLPGAKVLRRRGRAKGNDEA
jgi:hypothetical protein